MKSRNKTKGHQTIQEIYGPKDTQDSANFFMTQIDIHNKSKFQPKNSFKRIKKAAALPSLSRNSSLPSLKYYQSQAEDRPKTMVLQKRKKKRRFSMERLKDLCQPKTKPITEDDLTNKDLRKNTRDDIYEYVKDALENNSKIPMLDKIKFDQTSKVAKINERNKIKSEIILKRAHLKRLENQLYKLEVLHDSEFNPEIGRMITLKKAVEKSAYKIEVLEMDADILNHILDRTKQSLLNRKRPVQEKEKDLQIMQKTIGSMRKETALIMNDKNNIDKANERILKKFTDENKHFTNAFEGYIKEFKQITLVDALKTQIKDVSKKNKEERQKKIYNANLAKNGLKQIRKEENRAKLEENIEKLRKNQNLFAKIQSKCNVKDIHDLNDYHKYLQDTNVHLEYQKKVMEEEKSKKEKRLQRLTEILEKKKFSTNSNSQYNKIEVEHTLKCIQEEGAYVGPHFDDYINEDDHTRKEFRKRRLEKLKVIQNSCVMLIYRLSTQLKLGVDITDKNLVGRLTSIGLHLEHIMATLSKDKQKLYNLESINTDTSSQFPPEFMNIKYFYAQEPKNVSVVEEKDEKDEEVSYIQKGYQKRREKNKDLKNSFTSSPSSKSKKKPTKDSKRRLSSTEICITDHEIRPISQIIKRARKVFMKKPE
ncbi:unnamed protein product [Moneuplotes crassus]|uniref:Uncharacterized protein n=1 Tax=Euplotes crassus TaxID=5936 RepID=A0AAD2DBE9_EUPCR|nr:unnamed protein product [Moneuplotes crassus]